MSHTPQEVAYIEKAQAEDAVGRIAAATPLPGPTRKAFAITQDITVGEHTVRPFYDIDFEFLSELDHPMYHAMSNALDNKPSSEFIPRGAPAWQLAWLLTQTPDECEAGFKAGVQSVKDAAKSKFGRKQFAELAELNKAAIEQISKYWSTANGPAAEDGKQNPS